MATETPSVAPPRAEVPMVDAEVVRQIRELHRGGWGAKRIARELEVARNTVRRYLRLRTVEAGIQIRPRARQLDAPARAEALRLFDGPAEHNAVVVTQLLRERGVAATERVVQKVVAPRRSATSGACHAPCWGITPARSLCATIAARRPSSFTRPIWPSVATGMSCPARAGRIARGPKARRSPG